MRGDRSHPVSRGALCQKCALAYNGVFLDPAARVTSPLRRVGAKGSGRFEEIRWEDALDEIATRLGAIVEGHGGESVLNAHYTGTFAMIGYHFPLRFFNRLGATEVDPDTICNKAGHTALEYLYGTSLDGFDPRSADDAASILVWGANPSASAPHAHKHWLPEAPCPVVVVDPLRTPTAAQADLHLQPYPGSDAALAFGMMHVLERDGLIDAEFVAAHTLGFAELLPRLRACTPEWTKEVTGVPRADIERAAHLFGAGPSLLWIGQGLQRQPTGGNVVRAVGLLPALTGAVGRPGGGFLYLNGIESRGLDGDYLAGTALARPGGTPSVSHLDLVDVLEDPVRSRALFCWNINIAGSNPEQVRLRRALARHDLFTVVVEVFPTDTADLADIVLPAATFLEQDDVVASYFHQSISAQVKVVDPPGSALPNSEIFRRLAAAMGWSEPELFESDQAILDNLMLQSGTGLDFAALAEAGTVWPTPRAVPQMPGLEFPTPSGRIEMASEAAERAGLPRLPVPSADRRPVGGKLRLLSPASAWILNTLYSNDARVERRAGPMTVTLNPADAVTRHLDPGQRVTVSNPTGSLTLPLLVSEDVPVGVAVIPKGRWPKREGSGGNVNVLNPGDRADMGDSSSVHGTEVWVHAAG